MAQTWKNKAFERIERVAGVDPTVVVTSRVYGTDPAGQLMPTCYLEVTECFGELTGVFCNDGKKVSDLTPHVAKLMYDIVETAYEAHLEATADEPFMGYRP